MGICIDLTEKFRIRSDSSSFTLYQKGKNKKGEKVELPVGYYSTLEHAAKGFINKDIASTDSKSLREVIDRIAELKAIIEKQINI